MALYIEHVQPFDCFVMTVEVLPSTLGRHSRFTAYATAPLVIANLRAPSALAVRTSPDTTALIELSLSHPETPDPIYADSSFGTVPAETTVLDVIPCKIAAIRVTVTGPGSVTVEVLE